MHRFIQELLVMTKSNESDLEETNVFLAEMLRLTALTEANTARILAISPFNTSLPQVYACSELSRRDEASRPSANM